MSTNIKVGIKLRSGKVVLPREHYYYYGDSESDNDSYDYLCNEDYDPEESSSLDSPPLLDWDEEFPKEEEFSPKSNDFVRESIEKKVSSEIKVPNGFGDEVGNFLKKFNECYQDCFISHDQLHYLVKGFGKYLSWFPDNVPSKKIKKFCREAYAHTLWKSFLDEEITRRQFVNLMKRYKKFGKKPKNFLK